MALEHAFTAGPIPDRCYYWHGSEIGGFFCAQPLADSKHAGQSSLGDGPVRSTVERQQERIKELEAELLALRRTTTLFASGQAYLDELERVKAERDMAWDRLSNLDILAREVWAKIEKLVGALDK